MNSDIRAFERMLKTDSSVQEKIVAAARNYKGDKSDEKALFENVLLPVANEAGLSATYEEFQSYMGLISDSSGELSEDELEQVAGGKGFKGLGLGLPSVILQM